MCNYDSSDDFSIELGKTYSRIAPNNEVYSTSKIIYCENLSNENIFNSNKNNDINNFMNTCSNYIMFYKCYRFNTPENFKIAEEYECPDKRYLTYSYLFGIFTIILDIILSFIPWSFVFNSYKSILKINEDNMNNIERERRERNNRNITNPSSNEYNNSSNSNNSHSNMSSSQRNDEIAQDNSKKELDRQETKTIIVGPEYSAIETSSNKNKDNLSKNFSERELLTINVKKNINNLHIIPKEINNIINNNNNINPDNNDIVINNSIEMKKDILSLNINKNMALLKSNNKS
jgi:plasmid maintenance system antidote protein VapI